MIETWFGGQHRKSKRLAPALFSPIENVLNQKSSLKIILRLQFVKNVVQEQNKIISGGSERLICRRNRTKNASKA